MCLQTFGYLHYGLDVASCGDGEPVRASGSGLVLAAGHDSLYGEGLAVLYPACTDGRETRALVARYLHLGALLVKTGDAVTPGLPLGVEGNAGTGRRHLHLELDGDIACPCRTPQAAAGHTFWHGGADTTVDPALWLSPSAGQRILPSPYDPAWLGYPARQLLERSAGETDAAG